MRLFERSEKTPLLYRWDDIFKVLEKIKPLAESSGGLPKAGAPDIAGPYGRSLRAMQRRNGNEAPGLRSESNPDGSQSQVLPCDNDRGWTSFFRKATGDKELDVPKLLHWHICKTEIEGQFTGGGLASAYDHDSKISFLGLGSELGLDASDAKALGMNANSKNVGVFKFTTRRLNASDPTKHQDMHGILFVEINKYARPVKLLGVVHRTSGNDNEPPDGLPENFSEISEWRRYTLGWALQLKIAKAIQLTKLSIKAIRYKAAHVYKPRLQGPTSQ